MLTIPEKAPRRVSTALGDEDRHLDSLMSFQGLSDASSICVAPVSVQSLPERAVARRETAEHSDR